MDYTWLDSEIKLLQQYEELGNEIACLHPDEISDELMIEFLTLEARLLILNKYVIGTINESAIGVYSFNEALKMESYYINRGIVFFFIPLTKDVIINK